MSLAQDLHDDDAASDPDVEEFIDPNWRAPWGIAAVILSVELCERLCYYTLKGTMKNFLQDQGMDLARAAAMSASAATLCYLFCVPGGWLADTIGRYATILIMAILYCGGAALCAITSFGLGAATVTFYLLAQLLLIPMATGGIKPNISSFGADQFVGGGEKGHQAQESFFSFFYLAVNVGAFISFTFLVNMATNSGYETPYIIAAASMIFATCMFFASTSCYKKVKTSAIGGTENMARIAKHFVYAAMNGERVSGKLRAWIAIIGWCCIPIFLTCSLVGAMTTNSTVQTNCNFASLGFGILVLVTLCVAHVDNAWVIEIEEEEYATWCDRCWFYGCCCFLCSKRKKADSDSEDDDDKPKPGGVNEEELPLSVQEIRATLSPVPLLLAVNICFGLCYNSMDEAMPTQGCQMDCRYNPWADVPALNWTFNMTTGSIDETWLNGVKEETNQFNGAFLNMFDSGAIIIGTPLLEGILYPMIGRCSRTGKCKLGLKMVCGLLLAAAANFVCAFLEIYRKNQGFLKIPSNCGVSVPTGIPNQITGEMGTMPSNMTDMPAYFMCLPFTMIGFAEILVNPTLIGFAYMAAPDRLRSTVSAFNLLATGSLSHAFTATLQSQLFPENPNEGHLETYYYVNAGAGLLGIVLYFMVSHFPCGRGVRPKRLRDDMAVADEDDVEEYISGKPVYSRVRSRRE